MNLATRRPSLVFALSCLASAGACGPCDVDPTEQLSPAIVFAQELDFGSIYIDVVTTLSIEFENVGSARGEIAIGSVPAPFALESASAFELASGETRAVTLSCTPDALGPLSLAVVVDNDGEPTPVRFLATVVAIPSCDDDNSCTVDVFNRVTLLCDNIVREGVCDDDSVCTLNDTCVSGRCVGDALDCDDDVACTVDGCDAVSGCEQVPVDERCADGDSCTDDVCTANGCASSTSPDGTPCAAGVTCVVAPACFSGTCVDVVVPDGTPCASPDNPCSSYVCEANVCVEDGGALVVHSPAGTRELLSPTDITFAADRAVVMGDYILTLGNGLRRFAVRSYGYEFVDKLPDGGWTKIFRVSSSMAIAQRPGFFDVIRVSDTGLEDYGTELRGGEITQVFAHSFEVGVCDDNDVYLYSPDIFGANFERIIASSLCFGPKERRVVAGGRILKVEFDQIENLLIEYDITGVELSRRSFERPALNNIMMSSPFGTSGEAAFILRETNGAIFRLVDVNGEFTDIDFPDGYRFRFLGTTGRRVFALNPNNLITFEVDETGTMLPLELLPAAIEAVEETVFIGATSDEFIFHVGQGSRKQMRRYERRDDDTIGPRLSDGFAVTLKKFEVAPDNTTITVFGTDSIRVGDVASLTSAPVNPLTLAASPGSAAHVVFRNGTYVASSSPMLSLSASEPCAACVIRGFFLQMSGTNFTSSVSPTNPFGTSDSRSFIFFTRIAFDARFGFVSRYDLDSQSFTVVGVEDFDGSGTDNPLLLSYFVPSPELDVFTKILPKQKLVAVVGEEAFLFDFSQSPGVLVDDMLLRSNGLSATGVRSAFSVYADDAQWIVVQSGGVQNPSPLVQGLAPVLLRQRLSDGAPEGAFEARLLDSDPLLPDSKAQYVVKVMAVADNLLYLESSRESGEHFLDVYSLDDLDLVERIPFDEKPLSMTVLEDGRRLVGTRHALHFLNLDCGL